MPKNAGANLVLGVVVAGFIGVCFVVVTRVVPDSAVANLVLGVLAAKFSDAVQYFTGSTASSKAKDQTIADVATKESQK